ncbi:hypothetical protein TeGR_g8318 [Tetraparma gracilis]|uniref:tRNA(Ile)-lysidine synthetase n=1 Tax=Tetraparma gracilis TaxID=2962635 RepID=A0ABQ6MS39_9STRA|nr:hypothetical protein TeGR_g8318 [Tetraparma gracilis]
MHSLLAPLRPPRGAPSRLLSISPQLDPIPSAILSSLEPHFDTPSRVTSSGDTPSSAPPHLILSCSGGPDSICLLRSLLLALPSLPSAPSLQVVHFDHSTRAGTADDRALVEGLCASSSPPLPLSVHTLGPSEPFSQSAARDWRYSRLLSHALPSRANLVLTGHHRDDNTETFLHSLLRGAGPLRARGIAPERPLGPGRPLGPKALLLRPLLRFPKAALLSFCAANSWRYATDPSNLSSHTPGYFRNTLRNSVVPALERALEARPRPALGEGEGGGELARVVGRFDDQARELGEFLDGEVRRWEEGNRAGGSPGYVGRLALAKWVLAATGAAPPEAAVKRLAAQMKEGKKEWAVDVGGGAQVCRYGGVLFLRWGEGRDSLIEAAPPGRRTILGMVRDGKASMDRLGDVRCKNGKRAVDVMRGRGLSLEERLFAEIEVEDGLVVAIDGDVV